MESLKAEFTKRWEIESRWTYESGDDCDEELWNERDSRVIALEILEQGLFFWEHWGWENALMHSIAPSDTSKAESQRLATKLLSSAPLGYAELRPKVVAWANGDFSEYDRLRETVNRTLPQWLEQKHKTSAVPLRTRVG